MRCALSAVVLWWWCWHMQHGGGETGGAIWRHYSLRRGFFSPWYHNSNDPLRLSFIIHLPTCMRPPCRLQKETTVGSIVLTWLGASLLIRLIGCQECRIRRVSCDKAQPECAKCRRKGISCSGQGVEYRFSTYMSDNRPARKNNAAKPHSPQSGQSGKRTSSQPLPNTAASSTTNHYENASSKDCQILQYYKQQQLPGISISNPAISESNRNPVTRVQNINSLQYYMQPLPDIGPIGQPLFGNESETYSADENELHWDILSIPLRPAIEIVPAQSRMLFDHCTSHSFYLPYCCIVIPGFYLL